MRFPRKKGSQMVHNTLVWWRHDRDNGSYVGYLMCWPLDSVFGTTVLPHCGFQLPWRFVMLGRARVT